MNTVTNNEDAICDLLDDFARALYEKNAAGAIAPLADDAVAFDLAPPLKQDPDVMHNSARLEEWFGTWKSPIVSEAVERTVAVDRDVAYAYGLQRMLEPRPMARRLSFSFAPPHAFAALMAVGGSPTCIIPCHSRWTAAIRHCCT
jgi:ketosteroid isomerase-like protein